MNRRLSILISTLAVLFAGAAFAQDDAATNAPTASTNAPDGLDRNALELIVRNNIFDGTRVGIRTRPAPRPRADYFTFCGGAFDGPRAVAFFTGEGAPNKPLKPGDSINGFKVADVTFKSVKLQPATGPAETLALGMSMRREPKGQWKPSQDSANPPEIPDAAASNDAPASAKAGPANDNDILKRLRARRDDD